MRRCGPGATTAALAAAAAGLLLLAGAALGAGQARRSAWPSGARCWRRTIPASCGYSAARASTGRSAVREQASLEQCDFGLGPGKLEGAFARLPR